MLFCRLPAVEEDRWESNESLMMNANGQYAMLRVMLVFGVLLAAASSPSSVSQGSQIATPTPCASPQHHEFDFWLGDWDAFVLGTSKKDSRVRVERILDGCVVHEDYQSVEGHKGQSFSIYDASRRVWHQTSDLGHQSRAAAHHRRKNARRCNGS